MSAEESDILTIIYVNNSAGTHLADQLNADALRLMRELDRIDCSVAISST